MWCVECVGKKRVETEGSRKHPTDYWGLGVRIRTATLPFSAQQQFQLTQSYGVEGEDQFPNQVRKLELKGAHFLIF